MINIWIFLILVSISCSAACPARCSCDGRTVNCFDAGYTKIPDGIPSDTTTLNMEENMVELIEKGVFTNLPNLQELDLSGNSINTFNTTAFTHARKLETLSLANNNITRLEIKDTLSALKSLNLYQNGISSADSKMFSAFPNLEELDFGNNKLTEFKVTNGLENIKRLRLDSNLLTKFSSKPFSRIPKLETLGYAFNKLRTLEISSGLEKLKHFDLRHNQLNRFTVERSYYFPNLEILRLSFNSFIYFDTRDFLHLTKLKSLDLYQMKNMTSASLGKGPPSLLMLSLGRYKIQTIQVPINEDNRCLKNLTTLFVGDNPLVCDCQMVRLLKLYPGAVKGTCASPTRFKGLDLAKDNITSMLSCTFDLKMLERQCSAAITSSISTVRIIMVMLMGGLALIEKY